MSTLSSTRPVNTSGCERNSPAIDRLGTIGRPHEKGLGPAFGNLDVVDPGAAADLVRDNLVSAHRPATPTALRETLSAMSERSDAAPIAIDPDRFAVAAKVALRDLERRGLGATHEDRSALLWEYGEVLLGLVEEEPTEG